MSFHIMGVAFFEVRKPETEEPQMEDLIEILHYEYSCNALGADDSLEYSETVQPRLEEYLWDQLKSGKLEPGMHSASFVYEISYHKVGWEYPEWDVDCDQTWIYVCTLSNNEVEILENVLIGKGWENVDLPREEDVFTFLTLADPKSD